MSRPRRDEQKVSFELNEAQAIVLFEWMMVHGDSLPIDDHAEQIVLWKIEAALESTLVAPLEKDYGDQLARARDAVRGGA